MKEQTNQRTLRLAAAILVLGSTFAASPGAGASDPTTSDATYTPAMSLAPGEFSGFAGSAEGLLVLVGQNASSSTLRFVRPDGTVADTPAGNVRDLTAVDALGRAVVYDNARWNVRLTDGASSTVIATSFEPTAFGADGRLYGCAYTHGAGLLGAYDSSRILTTHDVECGGSFVASPDGALHAWIGTRHLRYDPATGDSTLLPGVRERRSALAFDAVGGAYVLLAAPGGLKLARVDTATGGTTNLTSIPVANATGGALQFAGDRLYVAAFHSVAGDRAAEIGSVQLGVEGFTGFHPSFDLPAAPDLVVAVATRTYSGALPPTPLTAHWTTVTVTNVGLASSGAATASLTRWALARGEYDEFPVPALAPGAATTFASQWYPDQVGAVYLRALVDLKQVVIEDSERNNEAWERVVVLADVG